MGKIIKKKDLINSPLQRGGSEADGAFPSPLQRGGSEADGVFKNYKKLPYNPKLKERANKLRKAGNLSEVLFWNQVKRKKFLSLDFHRQKIIGNYIVDFYCPALDLVVEIDGSSHNDKVDYDEKRDNYLKSSGLNVIHFDDIDIKRNLNGVMEYLKEYCEKLLSSPSLREIPLKKGNVTPRLSTKATPLQRGIKNRKKT